MTVPAAILVLEASCTQNVQELQPGRDANHKCNRLLLSAGGNDALTGTNLVLNMRNGSLSDMIVSFLRMATSAEIGLRADFFAPFVMVGSPAMVYEYKIVEFLQLKYRVCCIRSWLQVQRWTDSCAQLLHVFRHDVQRAWSPRVTGAH